MANKRKLVSFKDIIIKIYTEGVSSLDKNMASRATFRRAVKSLKASDKASLAADLEAWYIKAFGSLGRGRGAPVNGETRSYRVQQIKGSGPFLRLPLESLGVKKGDRVKVDFDTGLISIAPVAADDEGDENLGNSPLAA